MFTSTPDEIWDFFEYFAHETWEYENARETFSHPIPDPYMMCVAPLDESQFGGISYEHSHIPCVSISCDYCDSFDHDIDSCSLLGRPHILVALATLNRELYLHSLLKTDLSLGSSTPKASSCDDFDVRSETPIPLGHDFHDDTYCDDLEGAGDLSSPLVVAPSLEFRTVSDHPEGSLIVHNSPFPLAPLGELQEGDGFESDASSND